MATTGDPSSGVISGKEVANILKFVRHLLWTKIADFVSLNQNTQCGFSRSLAPTFLTTKLPSSGGYGKQ
jgi:hypothetical protein